MGPFSGRTLGEVVMPPQLHETPRYFPIFVAGIFAQNVAWWLQIDTKYNLSVNRCQAF